MDSLIVCFHGYVNNTRELARIEIDHNTNLSITLTGITKFLPNNLKNIH